MEGEAGWLLQAQLCLLTAEFMFFDESLDGTGERRRPRAVGEQIHVWFMGRGGGTKGL